MSPEPADRDDRVARRNRLRVGQWFGIATALVGAATVAGIAVGVWAVVNLGHAREDVVEQLAPAAPRERDELSEAATLLTVSFGLIAVLVIAALTITTLMLRSSVTMPVGRLARRVRTVARGDYDHPVEVDGPRDISNLAADIDSMRRVIVAELGQVRAANDRLDAQAHDLERSNAELEQFAYVASHDLQEPLRKVASFCQLLAQRYEGQLDERADQYIGFAVDGAKRMQQLINDLLAFSRVGREAGEPAPVDLGAVFRDAVADLDAAVVASGAKVGAGALPTVVGERSLLTVVLHNLVANAIKFRSESPPEVRLSAERQGDEWLITCTDNGIGIDPDYSERVFVIFQRLHGKDRYPGTGIGLAMCRKIVEYHGGRIWLEPEPGPGTTFRFTLPAAEENR